MVNAVLCLESPLFSQELPKRMHAITLLKGFLSLCVCAYVFHNRKIRRIKFEYKKTIATDPNK